jgi:environmental stress-induced protein Ves
LKKITKEQFKSMPWKNKGGITTELFRSPAEGDFTLRLSVAKVSEDSPFSLFPDVDRWLLILNGEGIFLDRSDGSRKLTKESHPFFFRGEEVISSRLVQGEIRDFNVMLKRNSGSAHVEKCSTGKLIEATLPTYIYEIQRENLIILSPGESYILDQQSIIVKIKGP